MPDLEGHYLWLVQLDIPEELDEAFNHIYDTEHAPLIAAVPGVIDVQRYVLERGDDGVAKYAAIYRVETADLPQSPEWVAASAAGQWKSKIRPFVTNSSMALYRALPTRPA